MLTMEELELLEWAVAVCEWAEGACDVARCSEDGTTSVRHDEIPKAPQRAFGPEGSDELGELVRRLRAEDASAYLRETR